MSELTVVVVLPGSTTRSLNASSIAAQAVACNRRYHSFRPAGIVAMYSTATIGSLTNLSAHLAPKPSRRASSSPACSPELKAICGCVSTAMRRGS